MEEEADEAIYWLELLQEVMGPGMKEFKRLTQEANELLSIIVASIKTARKNKVKNH